MTDEATPRYLVDVSSANAPGTAPGRTSKQDDLDWKWARGTGIVAGWAECYVGNDNANPDFAQQIQDMRDAGLGAAPYFFAYLLPNALGHACRDPHQQVALWSQHLQGYAYHKGDPPPMLDVEFPGPQDWAKWGTTQPLAWSWILAALADLDDLFQVTAGIYTYEYEWDAITASLPSEQLEQLQKRPFWVAGSKPWTRRPWSQATCWQRTGQEIRMPTTSGRPAVLTDCSLFQGSDDDWLRFTGQSPDAAITKPALDS
jgi:GH25 family lysozyme M1 (1,4-beta-N-acetylmuramidase)